MTALPSLAVQSGEHSAFRGAKVTVFVGRKIVTLLRDDISSIPDPGKWDLPGGGREKGESAWACAARECLEEVGLNLRREDALWGRKYQKDGAGFWFFVARFAAHKEQELVLGDEGQRIGLMSVDEYLSHPNAISHFQKRLADWVAGL